jgi:hypothetical protein
LNNFWSFLLFFEALFLLLRVNDAHQFLNLPYNLQNDSKQQSFKEITE